LLNLCSATADKPDTKPTRPHVSSGAGGVTKASPFALPSFEEQADDHPVNPKVSAYKLRQTNGLATSQNRFTLIKQQIPTI